MNAYFIKVEMHAVIKLKSIYKGVKTMNEIHLSGYLNRDGYFGGDSDSCLAIKTKEDNIVLAEIFEEKFNGKEVYIKYYITDEETTIEDMEEKYIKKLFGLVQASIYPVYSDITGYLWTNEEIEVNGHNLFKELDSYVGKFINILIREKCEPVTFE